MEIQQLRHLIAAAETANYSQAAERCSTSRQNVAHSIKMLEGECATTLFERSGNSMVLTPAGRQAVRKAAEIVAKVDALSLMFAARDDAADALISIAVGTNLFDGMPAHTEAFFMSLPEQTHFLEMDCGRCYDAVRRGAADVAVIMCMERAFPGCDVYEVAGSTAFALVGEASPLARRESVAAADLKDCELAIMSSPEFQYAPLFAQLDALGFDRSSCGVVSGTGAALRMVKRGAVAFVSGVFAASPPAGTVAVPLADARLNWHFYMLIKPNARNFRQVMELCERARNAFVRDELATKTM